MIDTDKYEGHTEGMWIVEGGSVYLQDEVTPIARMDRDTNHTTPTERDSNARLIADAPLLLAEVKRLREGLYEVCNYLHHTNLENEDFMELMYKLEIFERDDEE